MPVFVYLTDNAGHDDLVALPAAVQSPAVPLPDAVVPFRHVWFLVDHVQATVAFAHNAHVLYTPQSIVVFFGDDGGGGSDDDDDDDGDGDDDDDDGGDDDDDDGGDDDDVDDDGGDDDDVDDDDDAISVAFASVVCDIAVIYKNRTLFKYFLSTAVVTPVA